MSEQEAIRRLAKPIRRDIKDRIQSVIAWSRLLAAVDPGFQQQFADLGLDQQAIRALGMVDARSGTDAMSTPRSIEGLRRQTPQDPGPLKFLRRQLRQDLGVLMDEVRILRQLDPSFSAEMDRAGLVSTFDALAEKRMTK
jgi:hypothetical protein